MVYKRGNVWWFKFVFNGELISRTTRQSNKKVARAMEAAYKLKLQNGEIGIDEEPIPEFSEALRQFIKWVAATSKSTTAKRHETSGKSLSRVFAGRKLSAITVNDVLAYQAQRLQATHSVTGEPLRPATTNRELACLRALFNYWIRQGCRLKNPVSKIKFADEDNESFHVLTAAEESLYLAACSQPLYDIAVIMLRTAMRPGEVYMLEKKHINLHENSLQIVKGKTKAARRKLYFGEEVRKIFETRMQTLDSPYLFPCETNPNRPMVKVNNGHNGALKRCGLDFRLYDLRHTAATRLARYTTHGHNLGISTAKDQRGKGAKKRNKIRRFVPLPLCPFAVKLWLNLCPFAVYIDLVTLAAILGHAKIQMVLRYAHPVESQKQEAMLRLAGHGVVTVLETVTNFEN